MPQITLDVVSVDAAPMTPERSFCFEGNGGTIGRDDSNALVLPDKHRRVSRLHATVTFPGGVPTVANASTSLPLGVGETQLAYGESMVLSEGMLLEVGPYLLRVRSCASDALADFRLAVEVDESHARFPVQVPHKLGGVAAAQSEGLSTFAKAAPISHALGDDPFADLLSGIGGAGGGVSSHVPPPAPAPQPPLAAAPLPLDDPFAALFGPASQNATPAALPLSREAADPFSALGQRPVQENWFGDSGKSAVAPAPSLVIPEDFNPFHMPSQTARNSADPLAGLLGEGASGSMETQREAEPSIDALFAPAGGSNPSSLWGEQASSPSSSSGLDALLSSSAGSADPLDLFGGIGVADRGQRPVRDDLAEVHGAFEPPRAFHEAPPVISPFADRYAAPSPPSAVASSDALTQAFLKGANLPADALPSGLTPEIMRVVGGLLRNATTGAIDMLAARTATKLEVQASVTIISAQSNNPLKFLPNSDAALLQLLGKKMPGFMPADEAMRDAFDDLRAHEVGVIAGTRAALEEVLSRFDPVLLGSRLTGGSLLDNLLPAMRKTKLWDIYLERYAQIRREAEDDFQSIFGRAFVQAYELETSRMKQSSNPAKGAP